MANMAERFFRYCTKVFALPQALCTVQDSRIRPQHKLPAILAKIVTGIATGVPSFHQLEKVIREGTFDKVGGATTPSGDTLRYGLAHASCTDLDAIADAMLTKARHNKSLQHTTVEGYRVCATDGSGIFSTVSERLGENLHFRQGVHGETLQKPLYLEHVLVVSYVGGAGPKPILALQRIPPGQGETTVAREVLRDLYQRHCRYCDILTVDALYAQSPFINEVLRQNKDVVVRVKQEHYSILQDANALFAQREPDEIHTRIRRGERHVYYDLAIWDEDNFTSWEQVHSPLRCLKIRVTRRKESACGRVLTEESYTTHLVTSCPRQTVPALTVWKIAHARWDIENTGFHFLKHHFQLEHAYSYTPTVTEALLRLFLIAFNLFQLFVRRHLRGFNPRKHTLLEMIRQIHDGLVELRCNRQAPDLLVLRE